MKGSIIFLLVLVSLVGEGICNSLRVRRQEDDNTQVIKLIEEELVRLRHAENRLKKFIDAIETGLKSGKVNTALKETEDKTPKGQVDFFKMVQAFKKHTPKSFEELIKTVADDTHILLDELYGRLDETGALVDGAQNEEEEKGSSAEMVHSGLKN
ncbi:unnamed protein product [Allacma fusca]|uniref:Uncharacterized protein n=1 Tax=Allacma fusca TaxID=39272 RepID=A0A8J2JYC5_9HEXA|nr:unnamed protein product [Allacma fusca]